MTRQTEQISRQTVAAGYSQFRDRLDPVWKRIRSRFAVDTRALAALRIALGLILLVDLVHRAGYIELFYTDAGVYPVAAYEATYTRYNGLSIHALSGALWVQQLLFVVAGLFAVALILGYRTRLVGAVSLVLLFSLHGRNPAVLNGGDRLLRVLLFVSLVAPLGERWSVDALRRGSARSSVTSFGTAAVLVQPIVVFTSNAILKHRGENWYAGDALEIAMKNDVMTIYLGNILVDYPALLTVLNYTWVILLAGSAVFLLSTVGRVRALAAVAYMSVFAGMVVTMAVGLFPLVLIASVLPFLTAPFWDALARQVPARWAERRPTAASLGPLGRPPIEQRLLEKVRERGNEFAASYTASYARSLLTIAGVAVLVWMLLFAAADVTDYEVPDGIDYSHLDQQSWGLYAPDPAEGYSWYVVQGTLANGSTVDALDGGGVDFDRPPDASQEYETFRHRKFMQSVSRSGGENTSDVIAERYASWACERANTEHDGRVEQITLYQLYQPSPLDGKFEDTYEIPVIERDCDPA
ncbi:MAG: HTTM domain-containing protein [Haloarculaceae archaeon]